MSPAFTVAGVPAAESHVQADLARILERFKAEILEGNLIAVLLIGGFGRGEGAVIEDSAGRIRAFNDYDLEVITRARFDGARLKAAAPGLARELEVDFVDVGVLDERALERVEPTVFWYELLEGHRVLWGPPDLLDSVPRIDPARLPLVEATRLLSNRGSALLWAWLHLDEALSADRDLDPPTRRFVVNAIHKTVLAIGDAALIRGGRYHISYRERLLRVKDIEIPLAAAVAEAFREAHAAATQFKLFPRIGPGDLASLVPWWLQVQGWHECAFRWIEEIRLGEPIGPWRNYPSRLAFESLRRGLRHPGRYLRERRACRDLRGWARWLLDTEHSVRARLPFLLYSPRPDGLDRRLLEAGITGVEDDEVKARRRWRQAAGALVAEWHP